MEKASIDFIASFVERDQNCDFAKILRSDYRSPCVEQFMRLSRANMTRLSGAEAEGMELQ